MSLVINNNLQAANVAANLNTHYGRLATSTRRLSTGLRVNSAADDAAGLAIRELQRSEVAALNQGARNANDAISLIQVADGSLGIINEKLVRMKELAEQAATGTYDSTQRLMIESEYQAMASEITRIANATDFNGLKLLDGSLEGVHDGSGLASQGKLKIHFGSGNDSAEDYYYIEIGECTSQALGIGNASTWQDVQNRAAKAFRQSLQKQIAENTALTDEEKAKLTAAIDSNVEKLNAALNHATDPTVAWSLWNAAAGEGFMPEGKPDAGSIMDDYLAPILEQNEQTMNGLVKAVEDCAPPIQPGETIGIRGVPPDNYSWDKYKADIKAAYRVYARQVGLDVATIRDQIDPIVGQYNMLPGQTFKTYERFMFVVESVSAQIADNQVIKEEINRNTMDRIQNNVGPTTAALRAFWDGLPESGRQKLQYAWGQAAIYNLAHADPARKPEGYGIGMTDAFDFGQDVDPALGQAMLARALDDMHAQAGHMDFAGYTIATQEDAQQSLTAIANAIEAKDKIRAHLGALQNRLENTVSNLTIQAENLRSAESRISDVDVAQEMTEFVRSQILSQSAVAMLGQANSMPQMAMQLIGG